MATRNFPQDLINSGDVLTTPESDSTLLISDNEGQTKVIKESDYRAVVLADAEAESAAQVAAEAAARAVDVTTISGVLAGVTAIALDGAVLTRIIGGVSTVAGNLFPVGSPFQVGKTVIYDVNGTNGVVTGIDSANVSVTTISISPIGSDEPTLLGNVTTDDGSAGLPQTSADAETVFGRTPHIDDYAKTIADDGVVTEWFITAIDASGNIAWGNPVVINTSDYQQQTTANDSGKVLTGGATAGTFGASLSVDTAPVQNSNNLVSSGGVWSWFGAALSSLTTMAKTVIGAINELVTSKVDSATVGGEAVTKSGTTLQLPGYPTSLPASGGNADVINMGSLTPGTDILAYIADLPIGKKKTVYGTSLINTPENRAGTFIFDIYPESLNWRTVEAIAIGYQSAVNVVYLNTMVNGTWTGWVRTNDNGNAATLGGYSASDFADQESGTWTPYGDLVSSYSSAYWYRLGNAVFINAMIRLTEGATGALIYGLPRNVGEAYLVSAKTFDNLSNEVSSLCYADPSSGGLMVYSYNGSSNFSDVYIQGHYVSA